MPTFDTPEPISVTLSLVIADVRVVAGERAETVVDIRPSNSSSKVDMRMAEQTTVEFAHGELLVKTPKQLGRLFGRTGSIDVLIELPAGSGLRGESATGGLQSTGPLGECWYKTGYGAIDVDTAGPVMLNTGAGDVTVQHATGDATATTGTGTLRVARVDGRAVLKNSSGMSWVGHAKGDLSVRVANGEISVDRAEAGIDAKSAYGDIRIGEVGRGRVVLATAYGEVEVGIREGAAAWLDASSTAGRVRNSLDVASAPAASEDAVEVRARTHFGDVIIHRAQQDPAQQDPAQQDRAQQGGQS